MNNATDTGMIDYKQFSGIVGTETIEQFKDIKNLLTNKSLPKEFFVLYRLHEELKNNEANIHKVSNDAEQFFLIISCHHLMKSLVLHPTRFNQKKNL